MSAETDTQQTKEMKTGRERIVQVMHSLRSVSLVSHTEAAMHSLPTLLSYIELPLLHTARGGSTEGKSEVFLPEQPVSPVGVLSADVNGFDVCNKAKDAHS